ncbi:MAG: hypothetical protein ACI9OJ_001917 [Myxococcota bacterium]|jgi:hypothetical protein
MRLGRVESPGRGQFFTLYLVLNLGVTLLLVRAALGECPRGVWPANVRFGRRQVNYASDAPTPLFEATHSSVP